MKFEDRSHNNLPSPSPVPTPPRRISVAQLTGSRVNVVWDPPTESRGVIRHYTVHYAPPLPPIQHETKITNLTINGYFKPNTSYSFWVSEQKPPTLMYGDETLFGYKL